VANWAKLQEDLVGWNQWAMSNYNGVRYLDGA
jgi:hypothetical protein